jgi:hypothetical protein
LANRYVDQGATILDACTNLEWEQKTTAVGSGANAADLDDVDNLYAWSGACSVSTTKDCQPTSAAEALCQAQTPPAYWTSGCEQCSGGDGTCVVAAPSITTVWDWLDQLRTTAFAGHSDWRLPTAEAMTINQELATILVAPLPCGNHNPCIAPIFGPTLSGGYWASTTFPPDPLQAYKVMFRITDESFLKTAGGAVRAVRGGS